MNIEFIISKKLALTYFTENIQAGQGLEETIRVQNQAKAIILTDRIIIQVADSFASSQGIIYYFTNMVFYAGHIQIELHVSRVAQLLKISEIYTVRRVQVTENRFADLQVFILENDRITKIEFLMILPNLYRLTLPNLEFKGIQFPDQFVTQIRFKNKHDQLYSQILRKLLLFHFKFQ